MEKIKLGISACLLGENVRYDGGHKLDRFLTDTLGQYVKYAPVCPEVECGLGVPRETMHLENDPNSPRLVTIRTKRDITDWMIKWAQRRAAKLEKVGFCGFIFKSNSPSCGMDRVRVYNEKGRSVKKGVGIFARTFMEHFPLLPVEDETCLRDPQLRESFIERIFTLRRWRQVLEGKKSRGNLVDFHTRHKLSLLAHSPKYCHMMGTLVAKGKDLPLKELYQKYQTLLMKSLYLKTSPKKNANVLQHAMGYFKEQLSSDEKQELLGIIDHYKKEYIPVIVPVTLIQHYARKYDQSYLKQQVYLNPHPLELRLRNHV